MSHSSVAEVSEVNVMFSNLTEPVKENNGENLQQVLLITLYHILEDHKKSTIEGKTNHERSCQSISFILKTDYLHLKPSYMNEGACL